MHMLRTSSVAPRARRWIAGLPTAGLAVLLLATLAGCPAPGSGSSNDAEIAHLEKQIDLLQQQLQLTDSGRSVSPSSDRLDRMEQLLERVLTEGAGTGSISAGGAVDLGELRAELRTLRDDFRDLTGKYEGLLGEVVSRRPASEELTEVEQENTALRGQLLQLQSEVSALNAALAQNWTALLEQLEAQATSVDVRAIRAELAAAVGEREALQADHTALQEQYDELLDDIERKDERIEAMREDLAERDDEVTRLQAQLGVRPPIDTGSDGDGGLPSPVSGILVGRVLTVEGGNGIVAITRSAEVEVGILLYIYDPQDEQVATFRVTREITPLDADIGNVRWWGGTVQVVAGRQVEEQYRVSSLAE